MTSLDNTQGSPPGRKLPAWLEGLREDYRLAFVDPWSPYLGAVLIVMLCAVLMADGLFWGVFGGLKLWGDYVNGFIGIAPALSIHEQLDSPLLHRASLMNIALLLGAFSAALLSQQFRLNRPPPIEYIWAALGGTLMGLGANLAGGCTIGGFFTPVMFSSAAGWVMWIGLIIGAVIGLKLLLWVLENITWGTTPPPAKSPTILRSFYPAIGLIIMAGIGVWAFTWFLAEDAKLANRAIIIPVCFGLGFVLHRSRFCFARVIREPFMTAEGTMTKAMMLAIALAVPVGSFFLEKGMVDPYTAIPASFWLGSFLGGLVFGLGMVFAGGCATGSLWRVAEGHLKLVVAAFFFAWTGSLFGALMKKTGLTATDIDIDFLDGIPEISTLGYQSYLPDLLGNWVSVYLLGFALLAAWYLFVRYNESTERFTVL